MQGLLGFWQRRVLSTDRRAIGPVRRTDGYITRIATKPTSELRIADNDQRTGLRNLVEIGDPFSLRIAVMHQPLFALEGRGRVRVKRLMPVEQYLALFVQKLERVEPDAGEFLQGGELPIWPGLRPIRAHEDDGAFRDAAVLLLPALDIGDLKCVVRVGLHLIDD